MGADVDAFDPEKVSPNGVCVWMNIMHVVCVHARYVCTCHVTCCVM